MYIYSAVIIAINIIYLMFNSSGSNVDVYDIEFVKNLRIKIPLWLIDN